MKYSIALVTTITLMAAFVFSGCDRQSSNVERSDYSASEASQDTVIAESDMDSEFQAFRTENENQLKRHNRTIEEIKQKINNEPDSDVKARLETRLDKHEANHRELKREMDSYKVTGRDNWDDFKDSFSSRMDDLGDSLDDFFSTSSSISSSN